MGSCGDLRHRGDFRDACVSALEQPWLGEQSAALDRHWRRPGMGDDAERLGRDLADSETNHSMDQGQCGERHSDSGTVETHGAAGIFSFANECVVVVAYAVFYGGGEPLPDVREVMSA